jgi:hypothetical protein
VDKNLYQITWVPFIEGDEAPPTVNTEPKFVLANDIHGAVRTVEQWAGSEKIAIRVLQVQLMLDGPSMMVEGSKLVIH